MASTIKMPCTTVRQCMIYVSAVVVGSPQTQTQRDQVSRIILALMTQDRFNSRSMSGDASMLEQQPSALPSPVANNGDTLQSKLGSPRSATKHPQASPASSATGSAASCAKHRGDSFSTSWGDRRSSQFCCYECYHACYPCNYGLL